MSRLAKLGTDSDQHARVRVARRREHLTDATKFDQPSCIHHRQVVDETVHQSHNRGR